MFLLSSVERLRRYIGVDSNKDNDRLLHTFLAAASNNIQNFVGRNLELSVRLEYFDIDAVKLEFFPKAVPVVSIVSVKHDITGLFDGNETDLSDYHVGANNESIVLDFAQTKAPRSLRVTYKGGEAVHGTQSEYVITGVEGTFQANKFVTGVTSGAKGIVVSQTSGPTLKLENLYGTFQEDETLNESDTEGSTANGTTANLSSITNQSLAEKIPEYALAAEMEVKYMYTRRDAFHITSIQKEGSAFRSTEARRRTDFFMLQPEVRSLLLPYRRYFF